ncbi:MAG: LacI family DNA-binding transcriptional regulator [Lachnospiraceae bacterium]|nr:LacI family DNA-binding transcriptional regulator [Lachnospiraceae bacterium]
MKITMKQIAEKAGVHRSTVDKVIHNRPGVSSEVRDKIRSIIKEYDYKPNPVGIALKLQEKEFTVAVILMDVDSAPYIKKGIEKGLGEYSNYEIKAEYYILKDSSPEKMLDVLSKIEREKSADGIIIMPHNSQKLSETLNRLHDGGMPVVLINGDLAGSEELPFIGDDSRRSSRVAAHLIGTAIGGSGDIGIVTSAVISESNNSSVEVREKSFSDYIKSEYPGINIVELVENLEDSELTYAKTQDLLKRYPDIKGIYSTTGGASRIGQAVEDAGAQGRIVLVTHELYPEILELIRKGTIFCTIGSELIKQGQEGMRIAAEYLLYKNEPEIIKRYTRCEIVLKENIENTEP